MLYSRYMSSTPTREDVVEAFRALVQKGITNPFDVLYSEQDDEAKQVTELYDSWLQREQPEGTIDEQVKQGLLDNTVMYDAGFTDPDLLDEIASDWLMNFLSAADSAHRRDLAHLVQAKINEVQKKIQEKDPNYELTDFSVQETDWNPPREGGPEAFYPDYAYWKGRGNIDMDEAIREYLRLHPAEDPATVREGFEQAAKEYKEVG